MPKSRQKQSRILKYLKQHPLLFSSALIITVALIAYSNSFNLVCVDFPLNGLTYTNTEDLATQLAQDTTIGKNGEYP